MLQSVKAKAIDDAAPDLKSVGNPYTKEKDVRIKQHGNANEYAIAKLRKDRPDIHARALAGWGRCNERQRV